MQWTAWNNGRHSPSGAGYGLHVPVADRKAYFNRAWKSVSLELRTGRTYRRVNVNVDKPSFWTDCSEVIRKDIGQWLISKGHSAWPPRNPPAFNVTHQGGRTFRVQ